MEKKSTIKKGKIFQIILCIAVVALIVTVIIQNRHITSLNNTDNDTSLAENSSPDKNIKDHSSGNQMTATIGTVQKPTVKNTDFSGKEKETYASEINELEYQLDASEEELDMANEQLSDELSKKKDFQKAMANMLSNLALKKAMRDALKQNLDKNYDPLFKKLNISTEEFDKFKGILADRMMEAQNMAPLFLEASSADEKKELSQRVAETNDIYKSKISQILGEENDNTFQFYSDRLLERNNLNSFMDSLAPENRIKDDQMESLIDSMYEVRKTAQSEKGTSELINSASDLTEENLASTMERQARVNEKYVEASHGILTPAQVVQYKDFLEQRLEMTESTLKMSLHLYGGKTD